MSQRTDPYDDKYGAVITSRTGEVTVTVEDVTVTEPRRVGWEASDEQRALFIALETAKTNEDRATRITEAECERARAEWKADAYTTHVAEARKDARLIAKRDYWVAERLRLRNRDTTRTAR